MTNQMEKAEYYRQAIRLNTLFTHPSWPLLVEEMQELVMKAQQAALQYEGGDAGILMGLQRRARSFAEFYNSIIVKAAVTAELAEIGPTYLIQQEPLPGIQ